MLRLERGLKKPGGEKEKACERKLKKKGEMGRWDQSRNLSK